MSMFSKNLDTSEQQLDREFRKFIKSLKFNPRGCKNILELNRIIDVVTNRIVEMEKEYYSVPPSAYKYLASCGAAHQKLLEKVEVLEH